MKSGKVQAVKLSIVIPVFNEAKSIGLLFNEIKTAIRENNYSAEIIFVDDGSTDSSWKIIQKIMAQSKQTMGIRLRHNYGQTTALRIGMAKASGELLQTLDADLQHDPKDIFLFINKIESGFDLVAGWQEKRQDHRRKIIASRVFNLVLQITTKIKLHDINCGMKCYHRALLNDLLFAGDLRRFIPVQTHLLGYRTAEVIINSRPRHFGRSKYGVSRYIKGVISFLLAIFLFRYKHKPLYVLGILILTGTTLWLVIYRLPDFSYKTAFITEAMLTMLGILIFLSICATVQGIITITITEYHYRHNPNYFIAEQIGMIDN